MTLIATASQTIGPFFHFGLGHPEWTDLTAAGPTGARIHIEGQVLDGDRAPLDDALIEIWQANAAGKYDHPEDSQDKPVDPKFHGFGRCGTDASGWFRFTTIKPGRVPGPGNTLQAPHIDVSVFARGLLKRLVTRIYFADEAANDADPILSRIQDPNVRQTLLAVPTGERGPVITYRFDIILQGEGETAFFEI